MFNKIVTELKYSPALAGQLNAYIRRLRSERNTRQIGLIFISIALVVQLFAVLYPPESANARESQSFIEGGIHSIDAYLELYDKDTHNVKSLLTSLGISRNDINETVYGSIEQADTLYFWTHSGSASAESKPYIFYGDGGEIRLATNQPISLNDTNNLTAYIGSSPSFGWFAILKDSGNLVTKNTTSTECQSELNQPNIYRPSGFDCEKVRYSISATNLTKGKPADSVKANAEDRILYTLSVKNTSQTQTVAPIIIWAGDILDYSQLLDKGGGEFDEVGKILTWPEVDLARDETQSRSFIVKLSSVIPSTARGKYNTMSYDCSMNTVYGDSHAIAVACPIAKTVEQTIGGLPNTPARIGLMITSVIATIAVFYYVRSRQLLAELHWIQHNNSGSV